MWLGKLTALDMTPSDRLGSKNLNTKQMICFHGEIRRMSIISWKSKKNEYVFMEK